MRRTRSVSAAAALAAVAALLSGCGIGAGPGTKQASVRVTANFGSELYGSAAEKQVPGSETVMSLLERHFKVTTRYGGGFVESIDGHSGGSGRRDWFYFVNGIQAPQGAATTDVHKGDHIWWDLHDWSVTDSVPAVVGSYPEPFTNGIGGKEFPTLLNCGAGVQNACNVVGDALHRYGVKAADQVLGTGSGSDSLAVVVGTWSEIKDVIAAQLIAAGPRQSGVYAYFVGSSGQALELLNPQGKVVRTLHGSAGLIAATGQPSLGQPTWFVTGHRHRRRDGRSQGVHRRQAPRPFRRGRQRFERNPGPARARVMSYRRRASPLHAARAAAAIGWCVALGVASLIQSNPVLLGAITLSVVAAGVLAGVGREVRRSLHLGGPAVVHDRRDQRTGDPQRSHRDLETGRPARARPDEPDARGDRLRGGARAARRHARADRDAVFGRGRPG